MTRLDIEQKVYDKLDELGINYTVVEHDPLFTAEDLNSIKDRTEGLHCKNLFLRNAKGNKYYLYTCGSEATVDVKELKDKFGSTRLSFASEERLMKVLGLKTGSVNPFALANDEEKVVEFFIASDILTGEKLNFHPNTNTKTVTIAKEDLEKYLKAIGVTMNIVNP